MDLMKVILEVEVKGLGQALKDAREKAGLSLTVAGDRSGMSGSNFNRIENEETKGVPLMTLARAAKTVGVNLADYMGDWVLQVPGINLEDAES